MWQSLTLNNKGVNEGVICENRGSSAEIPDKDLISACFEFRKFKEDSIKKAEKLNPYGDKTYDRAPKSAICNCCKGLLKVSASVISP